MREVWRGIKRSNGTAPDGKAPIMPDDLNAMLAALPETLIGTRDRALLLVGFLGGFRRSELVALDVADLEFGREGLVITVRRSKTDQEGEGQKKALPYRPDPASCPVRSLEAWGMASDIEEGAVFRNVDCHGRINGRMSGKAVSLVVKRRGEAAGLDPAKFSGHSLRSGFATAAAQGGASERAIMRQTGHRSLPTLRRYIRDGELFNGDNAAAKITL